MTNRERVEAALRHVEPDRTPIFEYVLLPPLADRFLGRPLMEFDSPEWKAYAREHGWEKAVRQYAVNRLDLASILGHDLLFVGPSPSSKSVHQETSLPVSPPPPDDPVEDVRRRVESGRRGPRLGDDAFLIYRCLREEMSRRGMDLPLFGPAYAHGVWTDVNLMQTMVLEPDLAHEYFAQRTALALAAAGRFVSEGVEFVGVGGDFAGNRGPLISPALYEEFIVPEVRKVSDLIHKLGGWAINASDGNLWPVIEGFLIGCGVDGYMEIDAHAGMGLSNLKSRYGSRIAFLGNIDCGNTMSFASPSQVYEEVQACLKAGLGNGGHILTCSNAITASVPMDNYLALVQAHRDMFHLPPVTPL